MWESILSIAATVLGWFGFGGSTDTAAAERASGVAQGTAEQANKDQQKVLQDVSKAQAIDRSIDADSASGLPNTTSDGFRRD